MSARREKFGLWMVGVGGRVSATVAVGVSALKRGLTATWGMVTELPALADNDLLEPGSLVIGGHEVRSQTISESIREMHELSGLVDSELIRRCAGDVRKIEANVRRGTLYGSSKAIRALVGRDHSAEPARPGEVVKRLTADLEKFQKQHRLDHVVVVNVSSSEPPFRIGPTQRTFASIRRSLGKSGSRVLPASALYALAAIEAGCSYINFTPSLGIAVPGLEARAADCGTLYAGCDGKTGETLVKSILAPMFAMRNLRVLSWVGHNILGNRDGAVLSDPQSRASKIKSKDQTIPGIIGYRPDTHTSIEYMPSLDDWKVAWDFIHFQGFLGTKMNMQFTWQGSDSILAAPLIIDLVRLTVLAWRRGETGLMKHLACFFKQPMRVGEHDYVTQWQQLVAHVKSGQGGLTGR